MCDCRCTPSPTCARRAMQQYASHVLDAELLGQARVHEARCQGPPQHRLDLAVQPADAQLEPNTHRHTHRHTQTEEVTTTPHME
jgi:hypothetical protein